MKRFTTVFGILPVFVCRSKDDWGHARAMFIFIPHGHGEDSALWYHELFHVKQFYAWWGATLAIAATAYMLFWPHLFDMAAIVAAGIVVLSAFAYRHKYFSSRREIAAYGESLRYIRKHYGERTMQANLSHYAKVMDSDAYAEDLTYSKIRDRIYQKFLSGSLF